MRAVPSVTKRCRRLFFGKNAAEAARNGHAPRRLKRFPEKKAQKELESHEKKTASAQTAASRAELQYRNGERSSALILIDDEGVAVGGGGKDFVHSSLCLS